MGQVSEAGATNIWNLTCDWVGTSAAVELCEFSALWAHHLGGSLFLQRRLTLLGGWRSLTGPKTAGWADVWLVWQGIQNGSHPQ